MRDPVGVESVCHASKHLMSLVTIGVLNSSEFYFLRTYILQNDNQTAIVRRRRLRMIRSMRTFHNDEVVLVDETGRDMSAKIDFDHYLHLFSRNNVNPAVLLHARSVIQGFGVVLNSFRRHFVETGAALSSNVCSS